MTLKNEGTGHIYGYDAYLESSYVTYSACLTRVLGM